MPNRRHILEWLATAPLVGVLSGCAENANSSTPTNTQTDAAAAWRTPGAGETDVRRYALAHAILAPNPHNRQPWLISLAGDNEIILHFDTARRLPITDPFDRQLTIGCGAFLELLSLASAQAGYDAQVKLFPQGVPSTTLDAKPIASIKLVPGGMKSPLFNAIANRRSNKEAYDKKRPVAPALLANLLSQPAGQGLSYGASLSGEPTCETLRSVTKRAYRREVETPLAFKESIDLMRIGKREIAQYRDGIDLDFPFVDLLVATGQLTRAKMMTPGTTAYKQGLENYDPLADSAAGYVWIASDGQDRASEIETGRAYARVNLQATQLGLSMHPMSQALQEYGEMAQIKAEIDVLLNIAPTARLQMLARIGYGPEVPPAPRRGLIEHMV